MGGQRRASGLASADGRISGPRSTSPFRDDPEIAEGEGSRRSRRNDQARVNPSTPRSAARPDERAPAFKREPVGRYRYEESAAAEAHRRPHRSSAGREVAGEREHRRHAKCDEDHRPVTLRRPHGRLVRQRACPCSFRIEDDCQRGNEGRRDSLRTRQSGHDSEVTRLLEPGFDRRSCRTGAAVFAAHPGVAVARTAGASLAVRAPLAPAAERLYRWADWKGSGGRTQTSS